jgi:hypothetical protein
MLNPYEIAQKHLNNPDDPKRPTQIELSHWEEWLKSGVAPELIVNNIRSLAGTTPYEYLLYGLPDGERRNDGRLRDCWLRRYAHVEQGGWWCSGVEPLTGEPMLWGCFKPDRPRLDFEQRKKIKYEHPPKTPTRAFFLSVSDDLWSQVANRYNLLPAYTGGLHRFVNDGKFTWTRFGFEFWQWVLARPELPVIIVEGAKKAACLLSLGYIAIALPGIFNGRRVTRDESGKIYAESLIPDLELFATAGRRLIRVASWVIVADADAADAGINYIRSLRGEDSPAYLIRNDYQPTGYPVRFIEATEDDAIVALLIEDIRAGLKVFVATDAKRSSQALKKLVETVLDASMQMSQAKLVLINSDTSGGEYEVDFIRNINDRVTDADILIATPSMATGVSIEVERFDKVYGLFYGTVTDADASQALSRVRANIPRVVWCAKTGKNFSPVSKSIYPNQLKLALKTRWEASIAVLRTSLNPDTIPGIEAFNWDTNPHLDLWAKLNANINASMWNLRANLLERLRYEGNRVEVVALKNHSFVKDALAFARDEVKAEYYSQVAGARLLDKSELTALDRLESLRREDQLAIEKTHLADFYCVENVTPELVAFDNEGKRRRQILELEALLYGSQLSTKRDLDAIARQLKWGQGVLPFDQSCYELRRWAREVLGLLPFLVPGREWTDADLKPFGTRARACRQQVQLFFGFRIPDDPKAATNIWIFRSLLYQLGVKTKARRQTRQQLRSVEIDEEAWSDLLSIVERRQAKREAIADNYCPVVCLSDVVTPSYINKPEGVTTHPQEIQTSNKVTLTPQELQTGVEILSGVALTEAVKELERFKTWNGQQKRQLWAVVPSWLKEKIRSIIDTLRGHPDPSGIQFDFGLT